VSGHDGRRRRAARRVVWGAWIDHKPYAPAAHGGLQTVLKTARA
jgi:hypothetical protein